MHTNSRISSYIVCWRNYFKCHHASRRMKLRMRKNAHGIIFFFCLKRLVFLCAVFICNLRGNWRIRDRPKTATTLMPIDSNYLSKYYLIYFGMRPKQCLLPKIVPLFGLFFPWCYCRITITIAVRLKLIFSISFVRNSQIAPFGSIMCLCVCVYVGMCLLVFLSAILFHSDW